MKKTEITDLRALSVTELETKIEEGRRQLLQGRFAQVTEGTRRNAGARNARRNIARMLTIIQQKKSEVQA